MSDIVFYEKPGCLTNAKQKSLLQSRGYKLTVRNLLTEPWTEIRLYEFLGNMPVADWFNSAAPMIKSGQINPHEQDKASAMALLLEEPLLIRRPLLDTRFGKTAGFDNSAILSSLGIYPDADDRYQLCSKPGDTTGCPELG